LSPPITQGYANANLAFIFTSGATGGTSTYCLYYEIINEDPGYDPLFTLGDQTVPVGSSLAYTILTYDFEGAAVTLT
jgi:hypothetical protein